MRNRCRKIVSPIVLAAGIALFAGIGLSCGPNEGESPTRGELVVLTAESVVPPIVEIVREFNNLYKQAHIALIVTTSREAIVKLLNNEAKVVVSARNFNAEERAVVAKYDLYVDTIRIAYDAIAAVVHPSNPINQLSLSELSQIVTGKVKSWRQLSPKGRSGPEIFLAVGGPNTSTHEVLRTQIANGELLTTRLYPCSTSTQVMDLVTHRPEAIGFVGNGWLGKDSSNVKVLELGTDEYYTDSVGRQVKYFAPEQAHIYRGFYPLRRTIYIFSREKGYGLGAGFVSYVTSPAGQKIIKNHGLVPGTQRVRLTRPSSETS